MSKGEYNSSKVLVHQALACLLVKKYTQEKRNIRMKEIDQMLDQWIHNSIIRAKLKELITKEINNMKKKCITVLDYETGRVYQYQVSISKHAE